MGARAEPSVALVSGEAGIGKTRLVQELVRRAPAGTLVLAGQADPGTVGRPMELFLDAVDVAASGAAVADDGGTDLAALVAAVRDADRTAEERVRAGVDLVRALGDRAVAAPRSSCSRTCTGPTPRASPPSSAWPSPRRRAPRGRAVASCWSAPTGPTACPAATRRPRPCPGSTAGTGSRTSTSTASRPPR